MAYPLFLPFPRANAGGRGFLCGFLQAGAVRLQKPFILLPLSSVFAGEGAGGIFSQHTVLTELNGYSKSTSASPTLTRFYAQQ